MKKIISSFLALATVAVAGAQSGSLNLPQVPPSANPSSGSSIGQSLINIVLQFKQISTLIYSSLFVVALILFFVGIFQYLAPGGDAEKRKQGFQYMGFGVLALFVMVAIWGLVAFISQTLGIGIGGDIMVPGVPVNVRAY
jgi:hypothetical protein